MAAAQVRCLLRGVQAEGAGCERTGRAGKETRRKNLRLVQEQLHASAR
jgi:hypothetical protein